jgi:hypothetical protein
MLLFVSLAEMPLTIWDKMNEKRREGMRRDE